MYTTPAQRRAAMVIRLHERTLGHMSSGEALNAALLHEEEAQVFEPGDLGGIWHARHARQYFDYAVALEQVGR